MEHYQQFIDTLIALQSYYQQQVEEYSRLASEATEQLNHVDALLFDQLQRQYKQQSRDSSQTEAISETATTTLGSTPQNISPPELPALDFNSDLAKPSGAAEQKLSESEAINSTEANAPLAAPPNTSPLFSPKVELDSDISDPATVRAKSDPKEPNHALTTDSVQDEQPFAANAFHDSNQPSVLSSAISLPIEQPIEADTNESNRSQDVDLATTNETNSLPQIQAIEAASPVATAPGRSRYAAPLTTPLLPLYQHLSKSEAVENFLQSNEGKTFHIDEITRGLHGDLGDEAIRAERSRMYDTLRTGASRGWWSAVPNSSNYYTIDLNSLAPTAKQQELLLESPFGSTSTRRSKYSDSLLPRYRQMGLSQAVEVFVQENAGEILTPEQVTRDLFGDPPETALALVQAQVSKRLRDGAKLGLWQRVPGQQAQYILE